MHIVVAYSIEHHIYRPPVVCALRLRLGKSSNAQAQLRVHDYPLSMVDCQIYIATPANETSSAVDRLTRCLNDVNAWLSASVPAEEIFSEQN